MSDDDSRPSYLPYIMAALVLVVGGAKLEAARPLVARALAIAIPVVPNLLAMKRLEGGGETLERAAGAVSWGTVLAGEACVAGTILAPDTFGMAVPLARAALYVLAPGALVVHMLEARSVGKARYAGYLGVALGFAFYLSSHVGKDVFGSVSGAFFVGFLVGGGGGLLLGEALGRVFAKA